MRNKKYYGLMHSYDYQCKEYDEEGEVFFEDMEMKVLGIYSSRQEAEEALNRYYKLPGFNKYLRECFTIYECKLDKDDGWNEGFDDPYKSERNTDIVNFK